MKYTPEEIQKRIKSIEFVLAMTPDKISMTAEIRKDTEARLQELKDKLKENTPDNQQA